MAHVRECEYVVLDENGKPETRRPAITCKKDCIHCGFNPQEQKRRLEKGHFRDDAVVVIRHYAGENDLEGVPVVYSNLRQLVFPKLRVIRRKYGR